jgi:hypothetical protein
MAGPCFAPRLESETKTSRDVKRDPIHDWKTPANHLDSTPLYRSARIPPISKRSLRLQSLPTRQRNHQQKAGASNASRLPQQAGLALDDYENHSNRTRTIGTRSNRRIEPSDRARARRQWRAHRRARRVKEGDRVSVGRADQDRQGRVWEKRRDGVAARQQPVRRKRTWRAKCETYRRAC